MNFFGVTKKSLDTIQKKLYPISTMEYEIEDYLIEEVEYNGKLWDVCFDITYTGRYEDVGVGVYEYGSAKGVDVDIRGTTEDIKYEVTSLTDENGAVFKPTSEERKAVNVAIEQLFKSRPAAWLSIEDECQEHFINQEE